MNWTRLARHTAIAIGITLVVAAGVYLAVRLFMLDL
jgi:hypothetical protein